ncbi:hypothetical protein [Bacillus litorisediminis]|uniref:hypothetical protein n=1 Tax=Bacillus litorisediminis TaxID=2922713 RepID=UPI001FAF8B7F|nr:hypothetical protein [Bacillus litorisediminis]
MKIYNTVPYFLEYYQPTEKFLKHYHEKFSPHFKEYLLYHCKNIKEKMKIALQKYPEKMSEIKESNQKIELLIHEIVAAYQETYDVKFIKDVHIIVGCYGSNAFTHRQIIPDVTFCLEKLSSKVEHLKVIIAHEFGHVLHNLISDQAEMGWSKLNWTHPYTWLLQEGCATYFSRKITEADEAVCFSFDDDGEEWLQFAKHYQQEIITTFKENLLILTDAEIKKEWFSINGGTKFSHTRLGYYIGYKVIELLIEKYGEFKAVTLWKEPNFLDEMEQVLLEFTISK